MKLSKGTRITLLVVLLLVIDQVIKILVKTNMTLGQSIHVSGNWFQILFIENNGMAFGLQFGEGVGKLLLSLCRLVLIGLIIFYMRRLLKRSGTPTGVLVGLAFILCGAIGNMIDSMFYGLIFSASGPGTVASLGGHYAPFLYGKVVDMFYFPIIDTTLPESFPIWPGRHFIFFRPIFNFADSCITCGAIYLLLFQWKFFAGGGKEENS
ncbi:MAG: lipoprotein signal peptidase [Bacteroidales bacterium]|nr:lipoprotein signal peptidase [Bacteroidales bacterium]MBR0499563.1 lipoprotein signal peptidase [Bacteroidales bacterium]